jgi:hypothetical protein
MGQIFVQTLQLVIKTQIAKVTFSTIFPVRNPFFKLFNFFSILNPAQKTNPLMLDFLMLLIFQLYHTIETKVFDSF